jgi:regulator of sigma E protease
VGEIMANSAAERGGLRVGDKVLAVNGVTIPDWDTFASLMKKNPGKNLEVKIQRNGSVAVLSITPDVIEQGSSKLGRIGAAYLMSKAEIDRLMTEVKYAPFPALGHAGKQTWGTSVFSLRMLGSMLTGAVSWRSMGGPITIGSAAGKSATAGWKVFLGFLALISISLGVLNLLPVPVLDGGHLMYYVIEIFKGSPLSEHVMEIGQRVGIALLGLLMASAFYNDINRLISG